MPPPHAASPRTLGRGREQALSRLVKRSNDPTVVKRAMIVLHSFQGFSPPRITASSSGARTGSNG